MSSTGVDRINGVDPSVAIKAPCRVAAAANITLSGAQSIDGVNVTETTPKTRVLVTGQAAPEENGVYDVYVTDWRRSDDFNGSRDVVDGTLVSVDSGDLYAGSTWRVNATNPIAVGVTSIQFIRTNNFDSTIMPINTAGDTITTIASVTQLYYLKEYSLGTGKGGGQLLAKSGVITPDNIITFASATSGVYFQRVNIERPTVEMGGAVTGTDSTVALQRCLDAGLVGTMDDGSVYKISSRLTWTQPNSGFVCDGMSRIEMTRAGFSQATYVGVINTTNCGMYASVIDKPVLKGVLFNLEAGAGIRTAIAVAVSNCTNVDFERTHAYGFSEPEFGVFTCDSSTGIWSDGYVYDCTSSSTTLPSLQITGFEIDENRIAGAYSQISGGVWRFKNIALTGSALTTYGFQTDGVTLSGGATSTDSKGCVFDAIIADGVDEPIDIQSSNHHIGAVIARNVGAYGAKLVHAARNNRIDFVSVDQSRSYGVVFAGTTTASQNCRGNSIGRVVTKGIGALPDVIGAPGTPLQRAAIGFDGGSAPLLPSDNVVESVSCYDNSAMSYAVYSEAGTINTVKDVYCDGEPTISRFNVISPAECKITFRDYTDARYVIGRYYGGDVLNSSSTSALALAQDVLYLCPYIVRETTQFGEISFYVTAAAAGNARVGVYKMTAGAPGALVKDIGTISVAATGTKAIASSIYLPAGNYFLAIVTSVGISVYSTAANVALVNLLGVTNVGNSEISITKAHAYAALPNPFGAPTYTAANIPNLFLRRV